MIKKLLLVAEIRIFGSGNLITSRMITLARRYSQVILKTSNLLTGSLTSRIS